MSVRTRKAARSVPAYIAAFPGNVQVRLREMRKLIREAAPDAVETISYGIPAYMQNGVLVYFGGFTKHVSFFPTGAGIDSFADALKGYTTSRGTVQFPHDRPIPKALVTRIVRHRVKANLSTLSH